MTIFKTLYFIIYKFIGVVSKILIENFLSNAKVHLEKLINYFYNNFSDKTIVFLKYFFLSILVLIIIYLIIIAFVEILLLGILFMLYLIYRKL